MVKTKDEKEKVNKIKKVEKNEKEVVDEFEELTVEDRIINIEKKVNTTLIVVIIVAILCVLNLVFLTNDKKDATASGESATTSEQSSGEYDVSHFEEIAAADVADVSKNDTVVIYIGRESCGYCVQFVPVLTEVQSEYNVTSKYIDIAKIINYDTGEVSDQDAYDTLVNMKANDDQKDVMQQFGSTPMTIVVKNNKIINSVVGYVDKSALESLFEDSGFSK